MRGMVVGCCAGCISCIAGAAGAGDKRLDRSLVDHAGEIADVDSILLPVKVDARNMQGFCKVVMDLGLV